MVYVFFKINVSLRNVRPAGAQNIWSLLSLKNYLKRVFKSVLTVCCYSVAVSGRLGSVCVLRRISYGEVRHRSESNMRSSPILPSSASGLGERGAASLLFFFYAHNSSIYFVMISLGCRNYFEREGHTFCRSTHVNQITAT